MIQAFVLNPISGLCYQRHIKPNSCCQWFWFVDQLFWVESLIQCDSTNNGSSTEICGCQMPLSVAVVYLWMLWSVHTTHTKDNPQEQWRIQWVHKTCAAGLYHGLSVVHLTQTEEWMYGSLFKCGQQTKAKALKIANLSGLVIKASIEAECIDLGLHCI